MLKIKVSAGSHRLTSLFLRQLPSSSSGKWNHCQFYVNQHVDACDWWFVCHATSIKDIEVANCDPEHIVFMSMEPYEFNCSSFYRQFAKLVICDRSVKHRSIHYKNAITWWAGINVEFNNGHLIDPEPNYDYDGLANLVPHGKLSRVSVITSANNMLPGHRARMDFIEELSRSRIANYIDIFGGGRNPVPDKLDALISYKYHIALENSSLQDYWTEKIADSFLAGSLPFYYGCPNIGDYFPRGSFIPIDILNPSEAISRIEASLISDAYAHARGAVAQAKRMVLREYNIFNLMSQIADTPARRVKQCVIKAPSFFSPAPHERIASKFNKLKRKIIDWT